MTDSTFFPFLNTMQVGMLRIPYFVAILVLLSVLTFTALNLSPNSLMSSSIVGPSILQGPHHGAQKSTKTGTGLLITSSSQFSSVTTTALKAEERVRYKSPKCENRTYERFLRQCLWWRIHDSLHLKQKLRSSVIVFVLSYSKSEQV